MYAKIENGKIGKTTNNLKKLFPNVSFRQGVVPDKYEGWYKVTGSPVIPDGRVVDKEVIKIVKGLPIRTYTYRKFNRDELMVSWKRKMQESDNSLPRIAEDLMDIIINKGLVTKEELPAKVRLDYDNKKKIRGEKPK